MTDLQKEVFQAIKDDTLYDYIANNYYTMRKDELKDILLEALYSIHRVEDYGDDCPSETLLEGLSDRWE